MDGLKLVFENLGQGVQGIVAVILLFAVAIGILWQLVIAVKGFVDGDPKTGMKHVGYACLIALVGLIGLGGIQAWMESVKPDETILKYDNGR